MGGAAGDGRNASRAASRPKTRARPAARARYTPPLGATRTPFAAGYFRLPLGRSRLSWRLGRATGADHRVVHDNSRFEIDREVIHAPFDLRRVLAHVLEICVYDSA